MRIAGTQVIDSLQVGKMKLKKQSIGVSKKASGFAGVDGILGYVTITFSFSSKLDAQFAPTFSRIGPTDLTDGIWNALVAEFVDLIACLTAGTVDGESKIPTVTDTAYSEGQIDTRKVGISFQPDRKSTRLNSSHSGESRMPSSA